MARILIVYHSQTGNTEKMALAVAAGAGSIEHAEVVLKRAGEATIEDLLTGKTVQRPPSNVTFKRAPKAKTAGKERQGTMWDEGEPGPSE